MIQLFLNEFWCCKYKKKWKERYTIDNEQLKKCVFQVCIILDGIVVQCSLLQVNSFGDNENTSSLMLFLQRSLCYKREVIASRNFATKMDVPKKREDLAELKDLLRKIPISSRKKFSDFSQINLPLHGKLIMNDFQKIIWEFENEIFSWPFSRSLFK